ncbi:hypothetical protein J6590_026724 [Homalodisca vitripennis]|nr:hypothetical protein J6590_026724 [Homalodisca vitripennis]
MPDVCGRVTIETTPVEKVPTQTRLWRTDRCDKAYQESVRGVRDTACYLDATDSSSGGLGLRVRVQELCACAGGGASQWILTCRGADLPPPPSLSGLLLVK